MGIERKGRFILSEAMRKLSGMRSFFPLQLIIMNFFKHMEELKADDHHHPDSATVCHIVFVSQYTDHWT